MSARILVSDAETPAALAVVRSLGRAGYRVDVLASDRRAAAAASRWRSGVVRVPDAAFDPDGWTNEVVRALHRTGRDLFVPVSDAAMILADRARREIPGRTWLAMPRSDALALVLDKTAVLARAAALGIPVLKHRTGAALAEAPLPVVLKPRRSRVVARGVVRSETAEVTGDRTALLARADRLESLGFGAYGEPWIPGVGHGIFLLRHGGEVLARFAHRRIRESSPLGGPSAAAESVPAHPALLRYAEDLAADLGVEGPFMAEFRGQGDDFVLLEVNARYWGTLGLAIQAGVDFPRLHAAALLGRPERGPERWREGVAARHLAFDLKRAGFAFRGRPAGLAIPWPDPVGAVLDLLSGPGPGLFRTPSDPGPGRALLLRLLRGRSHDG